MEGRLVNEKIDLGESPVFGSPKVNPGRAGASPESGNFVIGLGAKNPRPNEGFAGAGGGGPLMIKGGSRPEKVEGISHNDRLSYFAGSGNWMRHPLTTFRLSRRSRRMR
jgi:hypothetical protein